MSDLSINNTLRGTNSMPSRSVSSGGGGGTTAPKPSPIPQPSEFITSPKGTIDSNSGLYIVQFRDGDGHVTAQYPAPKASGAYKRGAAVNAATTTSQSTSAPAPSSKPVAKAPAPAPTASAPTKTDSV